MTERVPVFVHAGDPLSHAGIAAELADRPELEVLAESESDRAKVAVVAADDLDEEAIRLIHALHREGSVRVVLLVARPDETGLVAAIEAGASGLLRRSHSTPETLTRSIVAAAREDGAAPPDLLVRLLSRLRPPQPGEALSPEELGFELTERELEVLKLVAEGYETAEIAQMLAYSERTIKNILHSVTTRFHLRNRSHAVAFAVRRGLI